MVAPETTADVLAGSPDAPAIYVGSGGAEFSRGQLLSLATQFAVTLRDSGIQPGDVVTIAEANTVRRAGWA
jgi:acyl-CoA synthetase (AMP-forming)/AMP-acid ligase II